MKSILLLPMSILFIACGGGVAVTVVEVPQYSFENELLYSRSYEEGFGEDSLFSRVRIQKNNQDEVMINIEKLSVNFFNFEEIGEHECDVTSINPTNDEYACWTFETVQQSALSPDHQQVILNATNIHNSYTHTKSGEIEDCGIPSTHLFLESWTSPLSARTLRIGDLSYFENQGTCFTYSEEYFEFFHGTTEALEQIVPNYL